MYRKNLASRGDQETALCCRSESPMNFGWLETLAAWLRLLTLQYGCQAIGSRDDDRAFFFKLYLMLEARGLVI